MRSGAPLRPVLLFLLAVTAMCPAAARAWQLDPADYGFKVLQEQPDLIVLGDDTSERRYEIRHIKATATGEERTILRTYSNTGALLEQRSFQPTGWSRKNFGVDRHGNQTLEKEEEVTRSDSGSYRHYEHTNNGPSRYSTLDEAAFNTFSPEKTQCWGPLNPVSDAALEALVSNSSPVVATAISADALARDPDNQKDIAIGPNVVARGCRNYPRGGISALASDLQLALDKGLRCLATKRTVPIAGAAGYFVDVNGPHWADLRKDAAYLLGFFQTSLKRKLHIVCQSQMRKFQVGDRLVTPHAHSITCREPAFGSDPVEPPAVEIAMENMGTGPDQIFDSKDLAPVLFHELTHQLGYSHNNIDGARPDPSRMDVPYAIDNCCFGKGTRELIACQNLGKYAHGDGI